MLTIVLANSTALPSRSIPVRVAVAVTSSVTAFKPAKLIDLTTRKEISHPARQTRPREHRWRVSLASSKVFISISTLSNFRWEALACVVVVVVKVIVVKYCCSSLLYISMIQQRKKFLTGIAADRLPTVTFYSSVETSLAVNFCYCVLADMTLLFTTLDHRMRSYATLLCYPFLPVDSR
jgi:hypothetical protein